MKKLLSFVVAIVAMMFFVSCSKAETDPESLKTSLNNTTWVQEVSGASIEMVFSKTSFRITLSAYGQSDYLTADYSYTYPDFTSSNIKVASGQSVIRDIHGTISEDFNTLRVTLDGSEVPLFRKR